MAEVKENEFDVTQKTSVKFSLNEAQKEVWENSESKFADIYAIVTPQGGVTVGYTDKKELERARKMQKAVTITGASACVLLMVIPTIVEFASEKIKQRKLNKKNKKSEKTDEKSEEVIIDAE